MKGHHMSIRTADIHRAIAFYQTLDFEVTERFTTGYTLGCWLEGAAGRLELIQIPDPHPPPNAFADEHYVGYYHLSLDVTDDLCTDQTLFAWLEQWRERLEAASMTLRVLLYPTAQVMGNHRYHVAFVADADGLPLELLHNLGSISSPPSDSLN
jgi:catechol 2,3-dioxygenase-like lactoylglutathione lyase family enzyme